MDFHLAPHLGFKRACYAVVQTIRGGRMTIGADAWRSLRLEVKFTTDDVEDLRSILRGILKTIQTHVQANEANEFKITKSFITTHMLRSKWMEREECDPAQAVTAPQPALVTVAVEGQPRLAPAGSTAAAAITIFSESEVAAVPPLACRLV
jgi:hypothetical protein